jgi:hypothetical protein
MPLDGSTGDIPVADNDPQRFTYSYFTSGFVPAATPTDILQLQGSATKLVKVRQLIVTGTATAASNILMNLIRRSTAATAGTPTIQTQAKRDTNDPAATSVLTTFAANPAPVGTLVSTVDGARLNIAPAANGGIDRLILVYSWLNDKGIVLRGVNDFLCLNLTGAAWPSGGAIDFQLTVTEE